MTKSVIGPNDHFGRPQVTQGAKFKEGEGTDKKDETEWMSPGNGIHRMMIVAGARGDFWWFSSPWFFVYRRIDR
jgi:hypothetical protein